MRARLAHRAALRALRRGRYSVALRRIRSAVARYERSGAGVELAAALLVLADVTSGLGRHADAEAAFARAVVLLPPGDVRTDVVIRLGNMQRLRGNYADAEATLLTAAPTGAAHNAIGIVCKDTGRYSAAAGRYDAALAVAAPDDLQLRASVHHNLAGLAHVQGRFSDAEAPARTALALREEADGPRATTVAADAAVLGAVLLGTGRLDEAEQHLRRAQRIYGPDHHEAAGVLHTLGVLELRRGRPSNALAMLAEALRARTAVLGDEHPDVAAVLNNLGAVHRDLGAHDDARSCFDKAAGILERTLGAEHPQTRRVRANADAT